MTQGAHASSTTTARSSRITDHLVRCVCLEHEEMNHMASDKSGGDGVRPLVHGCGSYYPGHDVHPMTACRGDRGGPRTIRAVEDDGTITFTDGSTRWNHDPARLRVIL